MGTSRPACGNCRKMAVRTSPCWRPQASTGSASPRRLSSHFPSMSWCRRRGKEPSRSNADQTTGRCKRTCRCSSPICKPNPCNPTTRCNARTPATVRMLDERLTGRKDVRADVAAIGEGTAAAYARWAGREPRLLPKTFTVERLARAFPRGEGRVLCARADIAPEGLEDALAAKGWSPTRVDAYRTVFPKTLPKAAETALAAGAVDAITFTSASTVRGFRHALGTATVAGKPKV